MGRRDRWAGHSRPGWQGRAIPVRRWPQCSPAVGCGEGCCTRRGQDVHGFTGLRYITGTLIVSSPPGKKSSKRNGTKGFQREVESV